MMGAGAHTLPSPTRENYNEKRVQIVQITRRCNGSTDVGRGSEYTGFTNI